MLTAFSSDLLHERRIENVKSKASAEILVVFIFGLV
jgi:hypothetical protein